MCVSYAQVSRTFSLRVRSNFTAGNIKVRKKIQLFQAAFTAENVRGLAQRYNCILRQMKTTQFFLKVAFNRALLCGICYVLTQTATRKIVSLQIERVTRNEAIHFDCEFRL